MPSSSTTMTNMIDWNAIETIAEEILYHPSSSSSSSNRIPKQASYSLPMACPQPQSPRRPQSSLPTTKRNRLPPRDPSVFLQRLYDLLQKSDDDANTIIAWRPDGLSFQVFVEHHAKTTIVQFLNANNFKGRKYPSFTKQLIRYKFQRIGKECYMHPLFQRDRPELFYTESRANLADQEWQALCTEINHRIHTATPDTRKTLLGAYPTVTAKGYVQEKERGRFQTRIYAFGKIRSIGTFSNEHEATFAYLMATTMVQSATVFFL